MSGDLFNIEHIKSVGRKYTLDSGKRKIRVVLVINCIELILFNQVIEMRKLKCCYTLRVE